MKIFSSTMTKDGVKITSVSTVADKTPVSQRSDQMTIRSGIPLSTLSPHNQVKLMRGESIDSAQLRADLDAVSGD
jgi:phospholipid N-methyltransferase